MHFKLIHLHIYFQINFITASLFDESKRASELQQISSITAGLFEEYKRPSEVQQFNSVNGGLFEESNRTLEIKKRKLDIDYQVNSKKFKTNDNHDSNSSVISFELLNTLPNIVQENQYSDISSFDPLESEEMTVCADQYSSFEERPNPPEPLRSILSFRRDDNNFLVDDLYSNELNEISNELQDQINCIPSSSGAQNTFWNIFDSMQFPELTHEDELFLSSKISLFTARSEHLPGQNFFCDVDLEDEDFEADFEAFDNNLFPEKTLNSSTAAWESPVQEMCKMGVKKDFRGPNIKYLFDLPDNHSYEGNFPDDSVILEDQNNGMSSNDQSTTFPYFDENSSVQYFLDGSLHSCEVEKIYNFIVSGELEEDEN
ncbi:hypothetical protein NPIL_27221 [Nephila pilipes]|uniref:Uncharacterized protein n=1 Tax=Nephila pilipes TaxID=299642 RepID=A0A8X6UJ52_NEPPI|nr:hypothetical protein NPIL_27221 [Nephila pilipes]